MPFAASNIGVRLGATAYNMAEAIAALARGQPLNSLEFSKDYDASEAVSHSGLKVWTTLPMWEGVDLDTFCPGTSQDIEIREMTSDEEAGLAFKDADGLHGWIIAVIVTLAVGGAAVSIFLYKVVQQEKAGNPMFIPMVKDGGTSA